jgi:hypothetical protein
MAALILSALDRPGVFLTTGCEFVAAGGGEGSVIFSGETVALITSSLGVILPAKGASVSNEEEVCSRRSFFF